MSEIYTQASFHGMDTGSFAPKLIAVGGGKGGIGKSMISSGLALSLAAMGHRTLAIDMDFGGANLHTWLGIDHGDVNLSQFLNKSHSSLESLIVPSGRENLSIIQGPREHLGASNIKALQKAKLFRHLTHLPYDWIILDLGAGSSYNVLDFFIAADRSILVCIPEPTSIENAYRVIRGAFFRKLQLASKNDSFQKFVTERMQGNEGLQGQVPRSVLQQIDDQFPELAAQVRHFVADFRPMLLVNQVISDDDRLLEAKIRIAVERFMGLQVRTVGVIRHDEAVLRAIRKRQNPVVFQPDSFAASDLATIAHRVMRGPGETTYTGASLF